MAATLQERRITGLCAGGGPLYWHVSASRAPLRRSATRRRRRRRAKDICLTATGLEKAGRNIKGRIDHEPFPPSRHRRRRRRNVYCGVRLLRARLRRRTRGRGGPRLDPGCFVPWSDKTKYFKLPAKKGPYRIALANGYIANTWRIQMIQTAKAYAAQPDVAAKLKEFKVVSTGEDVAAQIAAINNFIDSGYDAIIVDAQNPTAFKPVIKRAKEAGVVLVAFDNMLDTEDAINVDVDQKGLGVYWAQVARKPSPDGGKVLEVRGVSGTSVDTDRHDGIHETLGRDRQEVGRRRGLRQVGRPDRAEGDRGRDCGAEAFRRLSPRRAATPASCRRCSTRSSRSCRSAARRRTASASSAPNTPIKGLKCSSGGSGPAQVAVAIKTAIAALEGEVVPQAIKLPLAMAEDPNFKDGENYYPDQSRQLLRRQLLPDLQHQFHRAGNHGTDEGEQVASTDAAAGERHSSTAVGEAGASRPHGRLEGRG